MAKIAIVGCGAMGSVYAAFMAEAGHEVFGISRCTNHVQATSKKGLRISGASGDRTIPLAGMLNTTDDVGVCDLVIIATKAFDVHEAAKAAKLLVGPDTIVQTIQNGLGSPEMVAQFIPSDQLVIGVVGGYGASLPEPGHVHHNGRAVTWFGKYADIPDLQLAWAADVWRSAGFEVAVNNNVSSMIWKKLIMNVAYSGTSCVTGLTIGEIIADQNAWAVAKACSEEATRVAQALQIDLKLVDPVEHVRVLGGKIPDARPSMLLDSLAGKRGEVDAINGAICRLGAELGIPTPVNDVVVRIVKAKESQLN